jgi:hypothetical protein
MHDDMGLGSDDRVGGQDHEDGSGSSAILGAVMGT